ncbi:hypothetical protein FVF58_50350 [Paraburkholderia panacisoli]|uniref:Uncharacterized protein n=1 Tax=Paraburkholderia panacisoli TaxID=2603818 RepID=A0A5B0FYC7_9BURK|nr:hypothetical protein FVF58_50350 [Paraburkholderia panacisoli]
MPTDFAAPLRCGPCCGLSFTLRSSGQTADKDCWVRRQVLQQIKQKPRLRNAYWMSARRQTAEMMQAGVCMF